MPRAAVLAVPGERQFNQLTVRGAVLEVRACSPEPSTKSTVISTALVWRPVESVSSRRWTIPPPRSYIVNRCRRARGSSPRGGKHRGRITRNGTGHRRLLVRLVDRAMAAGAGGGDRCSVTVAGRKRHLRTRVAWLQARAKDATHHFAPSIFTSSSRTPTAYRLRPRPRIESRPVR